MRASLDNFLYFLKQIVTGLNGDDTPVPGTLLPGNNSAGVNSSTQSADGGIKVDQPIELSDLINAASFPAITDSTTGTASTTFGAIAGSVYATDAPAIKNALAQIALELNALHNNFAGALSSVAAVVIPSGTNPAIGTISFPVPRDYDEASDHLSIRLMAQLANADASITVTGTATVKPIATGTASTKSAVTATAPFGTANQPLSTTEQVLDINLSGFGLKRDDVVSVALAIVGTTTGNTYVFAVEKHFDSCIVSYNETDNTQNPSTSGFASAFIQPGFGRPLR